MEIQKKKIKLKNIEEMIDLVIQSRQKFLQVAEDIMEADNRAIFTSDLFIYGTINRALDITDSFLLLLNEDHYQSAGALLRLHLDTLLTLYSLKLVSSKDTFVTKIMGGKKRKDLKDKDHNKLTDSYLVRKFFNDPLNQTWDKLEKVYSETSGFIHFSDKHIYAPLRAAKDNHVTLNIGSKLEVPEQSKKEILVAFLTISDAYLTYLYGWRDLKKSYENKK